MSFDTLPFAGYLLAVAGLWWIAQVNRSLRPARGWLLLSASVGFYFFAGWRDLALVVGLVGFNWATSFLVIRSRRWLILPIGVSIAALAFFKYRAFLLGEASALSVFDAGYLIPLGISFYTFQIIAYQVDLVRGRARHEPNPARFALFVMFFPQLIAGPIVRAARLGPQVAAQFGRIRAVPNPSIGLALITLGLFKKVVLSDSLAPHVDLVFTQGPQSAFDAWVGAWLFAFQIYFDFSGYSDIAVGVARLFGIRLPFNFHTPYLSRTPQEFWRRWHITLSTWIRDYLYIPLGGSREGNWPRQLLVLLLVMGLAGLWHGASWTFVIWGLAWGFFIALWRPVRGVLARLGPAQTALTFAVTLVLWVLFRAGSSDLAIDYLGTMFGIGQGAGTAPRATFPLWTSAGCIGLLALHWLERQLLSPWTARRLMNRNGPFLWGLFFAISLWLVIMPKTNLNPFIYFRF